MEKYINRDKDIDVHRENSLNQLMRGGQSITCHITIFPQFLGIHAKQQRRWFLNYTKFVC